MKPPTLELLPGMRGALTCFPPRCGPLQDEPHGPLNPDQNFSWHVLDFPIYSNGTKPETLHTKMSLSIPARGTMLSRWKLPRLNGSIGGTRHGFTKAWDTEPQPRWKPNFGLGTGHREKWKSRQMPRNKTRGTSGKAPSLLRTRPPWHQCPEIDSPTSHSIVCIKIYVKKRHSMKRLNSQFLTFLTQPNT